SDSSPILCISSALDIADSAQGRGRLHEMQNQLGAAATITSLAMRAYTPQDVRDAVSRAFTAFASMRPRPAYLEIPLDLLKVPEGHPLCVGYRLARPSGQKLLRDADVVLCAGSEMAETDFWDSGFILVKGLIRIDLDAMTLARPHGADIAILADARLALEAIAASLPNEDHAARRKAAEKTVAAIHASEGLEDDPLRKMLSKVLAVIRDALPPET